MTPLGHASLSYLAGKANRHLSIPAAVLGGMLPDIDFLFLFSPHFNLAHRLYTHNLLFVTVTALLIGAWATYCPKRWVILSLIVGGALHLLADSCIDANPSNGIGVPFFWPFDNAFFSPFNLASPIENTAGWREPVKMIKFSIHSILWELPFYGLSGWLIYRNYSKKRNADGGT